MELGGQHRVGRGKTLLTTTKVTSHVNLGGWRPVMRSQLMMRMMLLVLGEGGGVVGGVGEGMSDVWVRAVHGVRVGICVRRVTSLRVHIGM
jgi:hypothetical protein